MSRCIYNPQSVAEDLSRVIKASQLSKSVRAVLLTTPDRQHALSLVKKTSLECQQLLYHFTVAERRRYDVPNHRWVPEGGQPNQPPPELLRHARELRNGGVVVFEDCASFLRDEHGDLGMRMTMALMLATEEPGPGLVLVFVEPPGVENRLPATLADQFVRLEVPYPRTEELEVLAREEIALTCHRAGISAEAEWIKQHSSRLAAGTVGLTRTASRNAIQDALAPHPTDIEAAFKQLQTRKTMQLSRELAMDVLDTDQTEAPIGLDYLVEYIMASRDQMRLTGPSRAKGILLLGPPGTGKTMLAQNFGRLVGLPVVKFRISSLMSSYLGETERNFSRAFAVLEAMAPNVVFIDEIEKAFGDPSERDGGTMMRATGSLLSWLSDNPYPNFIVGTANNLRRMGEVGLTMTRSERFDAAFFLDIPGLGARRQMFQRWLDGHLDDRDQVAQELATQTEKFSGADIYNVVKIAVPKAQSLKVNPQDMLREEIERKRMQVLALYDEFQELRRWGRIFCNPAGPTDH
jgi:AAA+ superfamily predicted ATPase